MPPASRDSRDSRAAGAADGPAVPAPGPPSEPPAPSGARGYGPVFRVREFRAVFAAHLLSVLGLVVAEISLTVLVFRLTGSPLLSALTFALGFLPYAVGGLVLGRWADRVPARATLVACDLLCATAAGAMVLPGTPLPALRAVMSLVAPLFGGVRAASLAEVLGTGDAFVLGRSLLRTVAQSAQLLGFALGGLLLALVPPRGALSATVLGFLGSALLLRVGTRARPAPRRRDAPSEGAPAGPIGGAPLLRDRRIRTLLLLSWLPPTFLVVPEALLTTYAAGAGIGTSALGLLMCAPAVGTIVGELWAGARLRPETRARITPPLAACALLPLLGWAAGPGALVTGLLLCAAGLAQVYTLGLDQWFVAAVPAGDRGRAMTWLGTGLMSCQGLGMAGAGLAAEFWPVRQVVPAAAVLGTCATLWLLREARAGGARGARGRAPATRGVES
ncbi:MFS transporter [Streptomyces sp. BI20]|uniref:MFS transporter n=1 Tax=Streptomyces sp. BI20 TaxID=3403460 RepID=UPI003C74BF7B